MQNHKLNDAGRIRKQGTGEGTELLQQVVQSVVPVVRGRYTHNA